MTDEEGALKFLEILHTNNFFLIGSWDNENDKITEKNQHPFKKVNKMITFFQT